MHIPQKAHIVTSKTEHTSGVVKNTEAVKRGLCLFRLSEAMIVGYASLYLVYLFDCGI